MSSRALSIVVLTATLVACSEKQSSTKPDAGASAFDANPPAGDAAVTPDAEAAVDTGVLTVIPASEQREGDPAEGYRVLLNEGYVGCGLPRSAYSMVVGPAPAEYRLSGRTGFNETLPYDMNAFSTESGVEVVASNCLTCHAGMIGDQVVIGLGDANRDFTFDASRAADLAGLVINDPLERAEWTKWAGRMRATAPYIQAKTIGVNPADNLGLILFAHHDQETLAWSDTPLLEPPPREVVAIDTPPWWRMKKKNAMFYSAAGRGDHARIMMTASVLCVDSVNHAGFIDTWFPHVRAYISSLEAPPYPETIDPPLAERGRAVFERTCARCHGTYGENETYPNLLISLEEVGTDPVFALGAIETERFSAWFNGSFYGELSQLEPARGYVAPPLDGIWITAPFLHNGSVPNIEALLDSSKRPAYFARTYVSTDYLPSEMGWRFTELSHGQADEPNAEQRKRIYDTTLPGMGNGGHTFGDALSTEERREVIEYLKTL
jgi:mono/diheme cytochrome c family protein